MKRPFPLFVLLALCASALPASALPAPTGFSFAKGAKFTVAGYAAGKPALSGFPVLVRLQANSPVGFSYADLLYPATGADLCFVDMAGNGLPFEIDTWDASGESLVWVRLPSMTNGTEFVMCWGGGTSGKTVCDENPFSGYVGVWHMSEASGTVADASGNGHHAVPTGATNVSVSVSGKIGGARQNATSSSGRVYLQAPNYDSISVGASFVVSGWFDSKGVPGGDMRLVSRKFAFDENGGWEVLVKESGKSPKVRGGTNAKQVEGTFDPVLKDAGWQFVAVVFDGTGASTYQNGALVKSGSIVAATDNGKTLGIGSYGGGDNTTSFFIGDMDEVRLRPGVPANAADWVSAEYSSVADAAFLTAGEAESYGAPVDLTAGVSVSDVSFTNATIGVSIGALGDGAASASVLVQLAATSDFASPVWSTTYSVTEPGLRTFPVAGLATNAAYFARALVTNSLLESVSAGPASFTTLAPGAPMASAAVSGRTSSSLAATVSVMTFGAGSDACTARLEASTDGFATVASFAETALAAPGSVAMEVSGLSPVTGYALRLRVTNPWGLTTLVDLGSATTLPASGLPELYVDSLGSGNGSSPESALPTIRAALDIAGPGYTIWVRGGPDRAYGVTNETDTLPIPAELEGLSIHGYADVPGDDGRALVAISDTYIVDGYRAHIISNRAANVTVSGLDFSFGTTSVGKQNVGSCSVFWTAAPFTTMENCLLRMPQPTVYAGSGAASPLVLCASKEATNFVMRGCEFRNTRCWSTAHGYPPVKVKSNALIACNVFSNVNATVTGQQADLVYGKDTTCYDLTFVSNVVYGANDGGNLSSGLLFGLYPGPKSAEIAFNRFVAARDAPAQNNNGTITHRVNLTFGAQFAEAFSGKEATLVHHNTIIGGQSAFLFNDAQGKKRKNQFFSNLILLDPNGTVLVENVKAGTTEFSGGRTTSFIAPSFLRNNAYTGDLTGGNATALATYDLSGGLVIADNIALAAPPDFVCTNDIYSPDFYRYRSSRTDSLDLGVLGWRGENNEYPHWIGATRPLYPSAAMMILK